MEIVRRYVQANLKWLTISFFKFMAKHMFRSRQLQEIIFSKKPLSIFLLLLTVAFCTAMTKNNVKFCQHVSQYEEKEYMIDLGVVTFSGSISIPLVVYMGGGGSGTSLLDLHVFMTFKEYVNLIWTGLFPNLRRLNEVVQKRHSKLTLECPGSLWNGHTVH